MKKYSVGLLMTEKDSKQELVDKKLGNVSGNQ